LFRILLHKKSPAFSIPGFGARRAEAVLRLIRLAPVRAFADARCL